MEDQPDYMQDELELDLTQEDEYEQVGDDIGPYQEDDPLYEEHNEVTFVLLALGLPQDESDKQELNEEVYTKVVKFGEHIQRIHKDSGVSSPEFDVLWKRFETDMTVFQVSGSEASVKHAVEVLDEIYKKVQKVDVGIKHKPSPPKDLSQLGLKELLRSKPLLDMMFYTLRAAEFPALFLDDRQALDFIEQVLNKPLRLFNEQYNLRHHPIGPENVLTKAFIGTMEFLSHRQRVLLETLIRYKDDAQEQFQSAGVAEQHHQILVTNVNQAIENINRRLEAGGYSINVDRELITDLELHNPDVAKQFLEEAFLIPLDKSGMRVDSLVEFPSTGEVKLKQFWKSHIKIPNNSVIAYIMSHASSDFYKRDGKNQIKLYLSRFVDATPSKPAKTGQKKSVPKPSTPPGSPPPGPPPPGRQGEPSMVPPTPPEMREGEPSPIPATPAEIKQEEKKAEEKPPDVISFEPYKKDDLMVRIDLLLQLGEFKQRKGHTKIPWHWKRNRESDMFSVRKGQQKTGGRTNDVFRFLTSQQRNHMADYQDELGFHIRGRVWGDWWTKQRERFTPDKYDAGREGFRAYRGFLKQYRTFLYQQAHKAGGIKVDETKLDKAVWNVLSQNRYGKEEDPQQQGNKLIEWYTEQLGRFAPGDRDARYFSGLREHVNAVVAASSPGWPDATGKTPAKRGRGLKATTDPWIRDHLKPWLSQVEAWTKANKAEFDELIKTEEGRIHILLDIWKPIFVSTGINFKSLIQRTSKGIQGLGTSSLTRYPARIFGLPQSDKLWREDTNMQRLLEMIVDADKYEYNRKHKGKKGKKGKKEKPPPQFIESGAPPGVEQQEQKELREEKSPSPPPPEIPRPPSSSSSDTVPLHTVKEPSPVPFNVPVQPGTYFPAGPPSEAPSLAVPDEVIDHVPGPGVPPPADFAVPPPPPAIHPDSDDDAKVGEPDPGAMVHLVAPMPAALPDAAAAAWAAYYAAAGTSNLMRRLKASDLDTRFIQYNPLMDRIESIFRHEVSFRKKRRVGGRARVEHIEVHQLKAHPLSKRKDETDIHAVSRLVDPLHGVLGTPSRLGSYIQLKVLPNVLNICIKKGVQLKALQQLAKRLLGQNKENPTTIHIKRHRKGKSVFKTLYNPTKLKKETIETFALKLKRLVKGKKYIHLVVKPSETMYSNFEESHLLK